MFQHGAYVQGHESSLNFILAPVESVYSNLGLILPHFRDIKAFVRRMTLASIPYPCSSHNFGFPLE